MEDIELKTDREVLISLAKDVGFIRENIETLKKAQEATDKRVDAIERRMAWAVGIAGGISLVISFLNDWVFSRK